MPVLSHLLTVDGLMPSERRRAFMADGRESGAAVLDPPNTNGESDEQPGDEEEPRTTFADLGLSAELLESVEAVGYKHPSPIQERTIPVLLDGKDVIAQAQTGSGKTAAFGLPIIEEIDAKQRRVQALVLCPTRELAIQVSEALVQYGKHKRIETLPIYGGQPYERQLRGLQRGVHIVVGTPGRVMDHMRRGTLRLDSLKYFILDEGDEMLDMGFIEDIEWVLSQVPEERQTALFSATMPPRISDLANTYLTDPQRISVRGKQMTVSETTQSYYEVPRARKVDALTRILEAENPSSAMIFCRTKHGVDQLGESLMQRGFAVETLHGDLSQSQRDRVMKRFRSGQANTLIATDVAARGLDVPDISHVINFDIPESVETYVHRIGRTGRAGRSGNAITIVVPRESRWFRQVERVTKATVERRQLPSAEDVNARRREMLKSMLREEVVKEKAYEAYVDPVKELTEDDIDPVNLAAALLKLYAEETGRSTTETEQADDVSMVSNRPREGGGGGSRPVDSGMTRLFINIGRNLGVRPQDFVGAIANEASIPGRSIGAIDIFDTYSFVDVPGQYADQVITSINDASIKGRPVNVEVASDPSAGRRDRGPRDGGNRRGGGGRRDDRPYRRPGRNDRAGGGYGSRRNEEGRGGRRAGSTFRNDHRTSSNSRNDS